jgi:hypothetical protein
MVMSVKLNNASANETKTGSRPRKSRRNHVVDRELFSRERLYGEIVVDFANAESPSEAFAVLKKHMQKLADKKLIITRLERGGIYRTFWKEKEDLRILLNKLKGNNNLNKIRILRNHIFFYNLYCKPYVQIQEDGSIEEISNFNEKKYISYEVFLSYCLINFLKHESEQKRRHIYSCTWGACDRFFMANKVDARNRVCPKCRNINRMPKEWRQQTDADRRYEKIEKQIADKLQAKYEYLRGSGYSEKEADKEARECIWEEVEGNKRLNRHKSELEKFIKLRHRF